MNTQKTNYNGIMNISSREQQIITDFSNQYQIPPEGLIIMGGKPYINYTGLIYKAKEIGLMGIYVEMIKEATNDDMSAKYKATVKLKDGSVYEDFGYGSIDSIKMKTLHNPDYINMTTITRAKNRALRSATGVGLVSAEEMDIYQGENKTQIVEIKKGEPMQELPQEWTEDKKEEYYNENYKYKNTPEQDEALNKIKENFKITSGEEIVKFEFSASDKQKKYIQTLLRDSGLVMEEDVAKFLISVGATSPNCDILGADLKAVYNDIFSNLIKKDASKIIDKILEIRKKPREEWTSFFHIK